MATFFSPSRFIGGTSLGNLYVKLTVDPTQFVKGFADAEGAMTGSVANMGRQLEILGAAATAAFVVVGALSVRQFAKFNQAMTEATAIMGDLSDQTKKQMESVARSLSGETIQSASDLAQAYFYLASSGLDAQQSIAALPVVARFATAGLFNLNTATTLLVDSQAALGLKSKDVTENMESMVRVSDVLMKANILSNATTQQFGEALTNHAAAALRIVNKDIEEGVAVLADFAEQGLKGAAAGEALSILLRDLQRTALANRQAFEQLGISVFDEGGKMKNLADIIRDMEKALAGTTDEQKRMIFSLLGFQDRSLQATLTVLGTSEKIRDYEAALRSAGGATQEVADKTLASFQNQWEITRNRINDLLITIGEQLAPHLLALNEQIKTFIDWLKKNQEAVDDLNSVIKAIVFVIKVFVEGLVVVWAALKAIATIIATGMVVQLLVMGEAVAAIIKLFSIWYETSVGVAAGLVDLAKTASQVSTIMDDLWHRDFTGAKVAFATMVGGAKDALSGIGETIKKGVTDSMDTVAKATGNSWNNATAMAGEATKDLKEQWSGLVDFTVGLFPEWEAGGKKIEKATEAIATSTQHATQTVKELGNAITEINTKAAEVIDSAKVKALLDLLGSPATTRKIGDVDTTELLNSMSIRGGNIQTQRATEMLKAAGINQEKGGVGQLGLVSPEVTQTEAIQREIAAEQAKLKILQDIGNQEVQLTKDVQDRKAAAIDAFTKRLHQLQLAQNIMVLQAGQNMFDSLAQATQAWAGQQSGVYKAMFAASKAFAIAESIVKIQQGIAEAASLPWPSNLVAIASVIAATASIVSTISSVTLAIEGKKAEGGPVAAGKTFLVGERGPELFTPSSNGNIIPNDKLGSGSNVRVIVNNFTDAQSQVTQRKEGEEQIIEVIIKRVKSEIGSEIRDGRGDVSKSIESSFGLRRGS